MKVSIEGLHSIGSTSGGSNREVSQYIYIYLGHISGVVSIEGLTVKGGTKRGVS
jgi:hypothetical protein